MGQTIPALSPHSITSSARVRSKGGISRPMALPVFRLIASPGFVSPFDREIAGQAAGENARDIARRGGPELAKVKPVASKSPRPNKTQMAPPIRCSIVT